MKQFITRITLLSSLAALLLFAAGCEDEDVLTGEIGFTEDSYTVSESATTPLAVTISINVPWDRDLIIPFTVGGTAVEGTDYQAISPKSVTIPQGSTSATINITPIDNNFVEQAPRTIEIAFVVPRGVGELQPGINTSTTVTITNDDQAGAVTADFSEASYITNEYLQDTVAVEVVTNTTFPEDIVLSYTVGGTAVDGTNFTAPSGTVTIEQGETAATIEVPIINTDNLGQGSTVELTLETPDNAAIEIGATSATTINIINPSVNDITAFYTGANFERLYFYNTFGDTIVPPTGRSNDEPTEGTLFENSFAFTYYDDTKPNTLGFRSPLWEAGTDDTLKNTNVFNVMDLYGSDEEEQKLRPGTVDMNISSGSAGVYILEAIRLVPLEEGATSGVAIVPEQTIRIYQRDEADGVEDDIHPSFTIGIKGEGTYDEVTKIIELRVEFDETSINNGMQVRHYAIHFDQRDR